MNHQIKGSVYVTIKHNEAISAQEGISFVQSAQCGAINLFLGIIRETDQSFSKPTGCLEPIEAIYYDAYESMAKRQIINIINETIANDKDNPSRQNSRVYVAIRLGKVLVNEASILICVSSTGRKFSHEATMSILNQVKSKVVIWKQVIFANGRKEWASEKRSEAFWLRD